MFCKQLRLYRRMLELTQAQLGRVVGVSASAIGMYEQGRRLPGPKVYSRMRLLFLRQGLELAPLPTCPEGNADDLAQLLATLQLG